MADDISKTRREDFDPNDWNRLVGKYTPYIKAAAQRVYGLSSSDADDLVQEVWLKVVKFFEIDEKSFHWGNDEVPCFRPFLKLQLHYAFLDRLRKELTPEHSKRSGTRQRRLVPASALGTDAWRSIEPTNEQDEDLEHLYALLADREELKALLYQYWPHGSVTRADERRIEFFCCVYGDGQERKDAGPPLGFAHASQWALAIDKVGAAALRALDR